MFCITLQSSDEEYSLLGQAVIPAVVIVTFINGNDAALGKVQGSAHGDVRVLTVSHRDELRQIAAMV